MTQLLAAIEPSWWDESVTGDQPVGTARLKVLRYYRPLAHGPVKLAYVSVVGNLPDFQYGKPYSAALTTDGLVAPVNLQNIPASPAQAPASCTKRGESNACLSIQYRLAK